MKLVILLTIKEETRKVLEFPLSVNCQDLPEDRKAERC